MLSTLLAVALLHWVVLVAPGANFLVVSSLAANGSRASACFATLGVTVVAAIWSALAVLGVNAVFAAHPILRSALQIAGGLYLLCVAVRLWRAGGSVCQPRGPQLSPLRAFRLGFITNIMNPKSALFFGSVFATALPTEPTSALLAGVVALVLFNALCWHMFLAIAFSHHRIQAAYARQRSVLSRIASALVGAFGLRLLIGAVGEVRSR
ncbi:MAG: LysE family transporter [Pseudomonadota bacterium]